MRSSAASGPVGHVRTLEAEHFYNMHAVNAFEDGGQLVLDLPTYTTGRHIDELYFDPTKRPAGGLFPTANSPVLHDHARYRRYHIPLSGGEVRHETFGSESIELPTIDYGRLNGRRHHIAYGLSISREPTATFYNQLVRFDLQREETKVWYEDLHYPSDPIFLHDPNSCDPDEGVLLSNVLDIRAGLTYFALFDAKSLDLRASGRLPHQIPFGFHGAFFSDSVKVPISRSK
jgi:carotenoid cleavage dioxygenase-like enzyme